jgi:myo-inositol-1(or 4)-monophosphatase
VNSIAQKIEGVAKHAARKAAGIQLHYFRKGLIPSFKGEIDLVTQADFESQEAIVSTLKEAFPDHHVLAEENALGHGDSLDGPIWVVDPLDGTTNFAHGFHIFAISIAFRNMSETQFGLIHLPVLEEWFLAHKGGGATLNGEKIQVSGAKELGKSLLATGFPYDKRQSPDNNLELFCQLELNSQCVRRPGAAAVDLANVACGRFDGFWELKLGPWDVAAGALLVEEAGGKVTDFTGDPLSNLWCKEAVATNGLIHDELLGFTAPTRERSKT